MRYANFHTHSLYCYYRPERSGGKVMFYTCLSFCYTGGVVCRTPWADPPPAQCMLGDTGNKRAVRILLECILVGIMLWLISIDLFQYDSDCKPNVYIVICRIILHCTEWDSDSHSNCRNVQE